MDEEVPVVRLFQVHFTFANVFLLQAVVHPEADVVAAEEELLLSWNHTGMQAFLSPRVKTTCL